MDGLTWLIPPLEHPAGVPVAPAPRPLGTGPLGTDSLGTDSLGTDSVGTDSLGAGVAV